ncbi:MAG: phage tail protein [Mesorhizobium sp.]|nr:phage tail protein [Mesorhizobium sp.]
MATYTPIVTLLGQAQIADAIANEEAVNISHMAVGDGNGSAITALETMTSLVNETWRGSISSGARDPDDPTKVIFTATIPLEAGPFVIREVALFASNGQMFAIGSYPEQFKPTAAQGAVSSIEIQFVVIVSETAQVTVTVNPSQLVFLNNMARQPWYAVDGIETSPPSNPAVGDMVIVGPSPQAAFFGHVNKLAQWNGTVWLVALPKPGTVAADATRDYLQWTGSAWVPWRATIDKVGPIRLDMFGKMPIYPEIVGFSAPGILSMFAPETGKIRVNASQSIIWRGHREFFTNDIPQAQREFTTLASKTYHLCFYPAGLGMAADAQTWPNGRFVLHDVTDSGYNLGFTEVDPALDTSYDKVLCARISTSSGNVATITPLKNLAVLDQDFNENYNFGTIEGNGITGHVTASPILLNWGRTPVISLMAIGTAGSPGIAGCVDIGLTGVAENVIQRYSATIALQGFNPTSTPRDVVALYKVNLRAR